MELRSIRTISLVLVVGIFLAGSTSFAVEGDTVSRDPEVETQQSGVSLTVVAEHPLLATPTGIDVDAQGQVWVVATHTHFRPDDYVGPEHDEVLVFSDQDGDGRAEQRRVFYNATDATMDLELGEDGWVYLAERDRILRIKDSDGDGTADVEESIAVLDTEADYPHNGLEGLAWHVDGDLVFAIGENFAKPWTLTGTDSSRVTGIGEGGILRCSADGKNLRRIARGFWNPFGICVRDDGEIFAAENDPGELPPCRLLHVVEGGDYGYQRNYGSEAHHPFVAWNGELRGTLPMIHPSGEAPCGVAPLGRGLLVPSWSDHRIDFFPLRRKGASYEAERIKLVQGSRYFRPSCIAAVSKSQLADQTIRSWYFCDWVDGRYQAHGYGRLWRLDVDLARADWVGPLELEPLNDPARLAQEIRQDKTALGQERLLELAQDDDPFLARAALDALSSFASRWKPDQVKDWPARNRIQAVLALKRAAENADTWTRLFLVDEDPDVQFEALRWIADADLKSMLPAVEQFLQRSDLDYRRFEAGIATWNTLSGVPESGIRNPEMLLARVQDHSSSPSLRAYALRLLPTQPRSAAKSGAAPTLQFPSGLTLELLQDLLEVDDETLSMEVVRTLAGNASISQELLTRIAGDRRHSFQVRAEAVAGLAAVADDHIDLLVNLAGDNDVAVREEALRCLRQVALPAGAVETLGEFARKHAESDDLYQAVLDPKSLVRERPEATDTNAWLELLNDVKQPSDRDAGRRVFHHAKISQCSNCHRHSGRGNVVGPDLSRIGGTVASGASKDRKWLLQSILQPSLQMAPEYQPRTVLLKDGRIFTGIRLRSSTKEAMRDTNGQNRTFDRDEIESMVESTTSFMPTGAVDSLTIREIRDLIEFLEGSGATIESLQP